MKTRPKTSPSHGQLFLRVILPPGSHTVAKRFAKTERSSCKASAGPTCLSVFPLQLYLLLVVFAPSFFHVHSDLLPPLALMQLLELPSGFGQVHLQAPAVNSRGSFGLLDYQSTPQWWLGLLGFIPKKLPGFGWKPTVQTTKHHWKPLESTKIH